MKYLYFTRSNGDVDSRAHDPDLDTDEKKREAIGDLGANNFSVQDSCGSFPIWDSVNNVYKSNSESKKSNLKDQLWNACTLYRKLKISEEGMIELKPHESNFTKAGQIRAWIAGLWGSPSDAASADGSYYARKAFIEADGVPSMDFSNFGELPVTFADAMQEILAG